MKRLISISFLLLICFQSYSQEQDWEWWNKTHGWEPGMPGWRNWLIISPGYLGPNALPVPELKDGLIPEKGEFEFGTVFHFKTGDPTQNLSARMLIPFAKSKIALELYGIVVEKYQMSETVRDERFARDKDGRGVTQGDFYFSTLMQLIKGRRFPQYLVAAGMQNCIRGGILCSPCFRQPWLLLRPEFLERFFKSLRRHVQVIGYDRVLQLADQR